MISIVITTYNAPKFLHECIKSIYAQSYKNYEIIIGIDGCKETLNCVLSNNEFYKKCKVFYFKQNNGPYITKNNLLKEVFNEDLLFFDSDDIMEKDMLLECAIELQSGNLLRTQFNEFNNPNGDRVEHAQGSIAIKRRVLNMLLGWQNWRCNADVEFLERASYWGIKYKLMDKITFRRRIHENNLTESKDLGMGSKVRNEYEKIIVDKRKNNDWANPIILKADYEQVEL